MCLSLINFCIEVSLVVVLVLMLILDCCLINLNILNVFVFVFVKVVIFGVVWFNELCEGNYYLFYMLSLIEMNDIIKNEIWRLVEI